jgi:hypothetical protein
MNKQAHNPPRQQLDAEARKALWQYYQKHHHRQRKKNLIPNLQRNLVHGWLLPYLGQIDSLLWGRWNYWARCQTIPKHTWYRWQLEPAFALIEGRSPEYLPKFVIEETLPDEPIPQIKWHYSSAGEAMLQDTLNCIPQHGEWQGWSSWTYLEYFLDWALFGFGHPAYRQLPQEPEGCEGASMRLYQMLDLSFLLFYPEDYLGRILPGICSKKARRNQGFYPTPLVVSTFMSEIVNNRESNPKEERLKSFYEPTVGTGSLMLAQSNYTLCGIGQDIDSILLKCALFQFYLFAPWLACPIWWLGQTDLLLGNSLIGLWTKKNRFA